MRDGMPNSHLTQPNSLEHQIPKGKQSAHGLTVREDDL